MDSIDSFPFQNVYFYIHLRNSLEVTALDICFKKKKIGPHRFR